MPGRPLEDIRRELGDIEVVKLASNEGPLPPFPAAIDAIAAAARDQNLYPDPGAWALRDALADLHGIDPAAIAVGNGVDSLIKILCMALLDPGDELAMCWPSFISHRQGTMMQGATWVPAPLRADGAYDLDALLAAVTPATKMAVVVSPNNPTGGVSNPNTAPTSTDMAQTYQDLSDKLSTELAGRMHQQLNEGQWKMKLGLKPSHLGAVDVELEMRDGKLSAVINADNATTQQLLNQGSPRLREALNALGWDQASVNIGQGHSSSAQSGQGQGQHTGQNGQHLSRSESIQGDGADAMPSTTQNASNALLDIYA